MAENRKRNLLLEEDWWSDTPNPARRTQQKQRRPLPRRQVLSNEPSQAEVYRRERAIRARRQRRIALVMKYAFLALFVISTFVSVSRFVAIGSNARQIRALAEQIADLENDQSNLRSRLAAREDPKRVRDEATYSLGMVYPSDTQIRVLSPGAQIAGAATEEVASAGNPG